MTKVVREPIATWWRISRYSGRIEPLQVVAFTGSFVTFIENELFFDRTRELRERRDDIFPTFAEAKDEAVKRCTARVESAKNELQRRRTELVMYESMTEPK